MSEVAIELTPGNQTEGRLPPPPGAGVEVVAVRPKIEGCNTTEKAKALVLILRSSTLLFSLITFLLVVTLSEFTSYASMSYLFSIVLMVVVYTTVLIGIYGHELRTGDVVIPQNIAVWINVIGDQVLALLLLSAASSGAQAVTAVRQVYYGPIVDQATASVAMAFLAFISLEPAAIISTYYFSLQFSTT